MDEIDYRYAYHKLLRKYRIIARAFARRTGIIEYRKALKEVAADEDKTARDTLRAQKQHEESFYRRSPARPG